MEDKFSYDSRKKILTRTIKDEQPIKLQEQEAGDFVMNQIQTYNVEGVKLLMSELSNQRADIQKMLTQANEMLERTKNLDEEEGLEELREQLSKLKQLDGRFKAKEQRDYALEQLSVVNRQYNDIKAQVEKHIKL